MDKHVIYRVVSILLSAILTQVTLAEDVMATVQDAMVNKLINVISAKITF